MFRSMYGARDLISSLEKLEKMNLQNENESKFSPFHDYLGLIKLVRPSISPLDSSTDADLFFDYITASSHRQRMDSVDSDAVSDSASSDGCRSESEISLDSVSVSNDIVPSVLNHQQVSFVDMSTISQTYAKTLETIIAQQKNVMDRLSPPGGKDKLNKSGNKASVCVFCRNNGESREFYSSHTLKDADSNTTCPILRAYTCPLCKANGDNSHTIKYCPRYTPKLKADKILGVGL